MRSKTQSVLAVICLCGRLVAQSDDANLLDQVANHGLARLDNQVETYYSAGAKARAIKLEAAISDMIAYYRQKLSIETPVYLAVLDSADWKALSESPYGLPNVNGPPPVVFMPATSGGLAFQLVLGRREAIPTEILSRFLKENSMTFEEVADGFVDVIGYHELGHVLCWEYGIDVPTHWLNELMASYFAYAFIYERLPEARSIFDLCGRPSKVRPKNTTLEDLERLYAAVDDYGWYQGMFEARIKEIYPKIGLQFIENVKQRFPRAEGAAADSSAAKEITPQQVVMEVEKFAPGFEDWAKEFHR